MAAFATTPAGDRAARSGLALGTDQAHSQLLLEQTAAAAAALASPCGAEVESALEASPPGLPHAAAGRGAGTRRREPSAQLGPAALPDRLTTYAWRLRWWASTTR